MSTGQKLSLYRSLLREINLASPVPLARRSYHIIKHYRTLFERSCRSKDDTSVKRDIGNLVTLLRSQRMHKVLLERYNPLHDLSTEERVKASARRVGLDMPVANHPDKE